MSMGWGEPGRPEGGEGRVRPAEILAGLKDFQRRTVDYVFRRLYRDEPGARRFLIADEVGLGKTLVARGLIARVIDELWHRRDRVTVVYVCSNAGIARQNIQRLNVTGRRDFALASRVTLLPSILPDLERNRLNFVSFTPGTSFDLRSNLGIVRERAILYRLLQSAWGFHNTDSSLAVLAGNASPDSLSRELRALDEGPPLANTLVRAFHRALADAPDARHRERFDRLRQLARRDGTLTAEAGRERNLWVGELRALLARSCLGALKPDLIILDEFQRFKHLLGGAAGEPTELSELVADLFNYPDARVLLLSATPYKMYTLGQEDEDDHYRDFLQTLRFLQPGTGGFEVLLDSYRRELYRLEAGSLDRLRAVQRCLADRLRQVMTRTERLAASADRGGMLREVPPHGLRLEPADLEAYLALQRLAREVTHDDTLEYWKSAPYLLNFMDGYELKVAFDRALGSPSRQARLAGILSDAGNLLLPLKTLAAYRAVEPGNARMRWLQEDTVGRDWWRLLWVPPALPYYRLGGAFARAAEAGLTKRLVFSAWRVVPKVIATLLSYEAERHMVRHREGSPRNTPKARKKRRPLLRFTRSKGRLTGMPVLGLIYPSAALARLGDALSLQPAAPGAGLLTARESLRRIEERLEPRLRELTSRHGSEGPPDEAWYWATPLLLDMQEDAERTRAWFDASDRPDLWAGAGEQAQSARHSHRWAQHVEEARRLLRGEVTLGPPPADLGRVVALLALAGPAVAALRSLARVAGGPEAGAFRDHAGPVGWAFLTLFNQPEVTTLLRGRDEAEPYWRHVLRYCVAGGLQSVMDEYAHLLRESLGLKGADPREVAAGVSEAMCLALRVRTSSMGVTDVRPNAPAGKVCVEDAHLRGRFAMRLGDERDEGGEVTRADQVRDAFNSPFWPFVLATTSIGQEGLDFHPYCHAVVHWNLPANPVDLEQREGRVHRFKGHAVRKNLARLHHALGRRAGAADPWEVMFEEARRRRPAGENDLNPYWVLPVDGGAAIERHVPALPLSRDRERLEDLRRSLAVYRMVFGQNRQEDLVAFLRAHCPADQLEHLVRELQIDLTPPAS